jgi:hypothetical protein
MSPEAHYASLPILEATHAPGHPADSLKPVRLQLRNDTLYVAYVGQPRIDLFTGQLDSIGTIRLDNPEPVFPTDFFMADSELYVCDHARGIIATYNKNGQLKESYGTLPDGSTGLRPFALTYHRGILYVGEAGLRKVLAIVMEASPGVTERGELILAIPTDTAHSLVFPSALMVTPDGRLIIGDGGRGGVEAFTCDGRYIYPFDSLPGSPSAGPQGFALDDIIDPSMQDTLSFDPSGIREMGRIHMVDAQLGKLHMYNPIGRYIASYPENESLEKPSDIAIDVINQRVYVAEPATGRILVYRYGE